MGRAPVGERVNVLAECKGPGPSTFTITLITGLTYPRGIHTVPPFIGKNNGERFLRLMNVLLRDGVLVWGDYLILDNSSIHFARDQREELLKVLEHHGVQICFLPTYSPELNPCENVFYLVKKMVQGTSTGRTLNAGGFIDRVQSAFSRVTLEFVRSCYRQCINSPTVT
jgi:transposase